MKAGGSAWIPSFLGSGLLSDEDAGWDEDLGVSVGSLGFVDCSVKESTVVARESSEWWGEGEARESAILDEASRLKCDRTGALVPFLGRCGRACEDFGAAERFLAMMAAGWRLVVKSL